MIHQNADYGGYSSYGGYDGYGTRYGGVVVGFYGAYCNPDGNGRYMHGKWVCGVAGASPFLFVYSLDYDCTRLANDAKVFCLLLLLLFSYFSSTFDAKNLIFEILILR